MTIDIKAVTNTDMYINLSVRDKIKINENALSSVNMRILGIKESMETGMWRADKSIQLNSLRQERDMITHNLRQLREFEKTVAK